MGSLIGIFLLWCLVAVPFGYLFAYVEGRVNQAPHRTRSAILLSVLLGPIGWNILAMRSGLTYAGTQKQNSDVTAEAARAVLRQQAEQQDQGWLPPQ